MRGMSERQYAAHVGLSRGAIQKAKTAERLVLYPDGSIDAVALRPPSTSPRQVPSCRAGDTAVPGPAPLTPARRGDWSAARAPSSPPSRRSGLRAGGRWHRRA